IKGLYARNGSVGDIEASKVIDRHRERVPFICSKDKPIEVTYFSFMPGKSFPKQKIARKPFTGVLQIRAYPITQRTPKGIYGVVEKSIRDAGITLQSLPIEHGFHAWKRDTEDPHLHNFEIYIAADTHVASLDGYPAVVVCGKNMNHGCTISTHTNTVSFRIEFRNVRQELWPEFYNAVLQYTNQIVIQEGPKQQENKGG
ncbi:MAG: hypothetical protein OXT65_00005, partial [Alphaproteobacteria bacterium]|nr:hypothetical protein [Alphaproteobacteria bacterium]